jgi:hypothetical protein
MIEIIFMLLEEQGDVLFNKWRTDYQKGILNEDDFYNYVVNKYKFELRNK